MTIFVSYTRADESLVRALRDDLGRMGHQVWLDHEIHGGELWWREIIRTIQAARVFVFALSQASWKSVPCHAEFDYAQQLGVPVLPVQVGPLDNLRIPIMERQLVDYRERSADAIVSLAGALTELTARPRVLPNPLPPPPKVPFEYLYRIAELLGPQPIAPDRQEIIIGQLRRHLRTERDEIARADIVTLLREFRERGEITNMNTREIDEILAGMEPGEGEGLPEGVTWLSAADHWQQNPVVIGPPPEPEHVPPTAEQPKPTPSSPQPATAEPSIPESRTPGPSDAAPGRQWWQGTEQGPRAPQPSAGEPSPSATKSSEPHPPEPHPSGPLPSTPEPPVPPSSHGRSLAFVGAVLGATGIPFLPLALVGASETTLIAVLFGLAVIAGLVLGVVAVGRHEPRSRQVLVIASVGLVGVLLALMIP
ncbi:TIR domain-containing protein [Actinosynnema sp. NPDC050801]|uniref:TIR domain-containing protein n=1 Tax=unclassified Actinosynnema TaxID=2637065 RepID=UPI00340A444D